VLNDVKDEKWCQNITTPKKNLLGEQHVYLLEYDFNFGGE